MKYIIASIALITIVCMGFMYILVNANPDIFNPDSNEQEVVDPPGRTYGEVEAYWNNRFREEGIPIN